MTRSLPGYAEDAVCKCQYGLLSPTLAVNVRAYAVDSLCLTLVKFHQKGGMCCIVHGVYYIATLTIRFPWLDIGSLERNSKQRAYERGNLYVFNHKSLAELPGFARDSRSIICILLYEPYANESSQICPFLAVRPQFDSEHHQNRMLSSHSYSREAVIFLYFLDSRVGYFIPLNGPLNGHPPSYTCSSGSFPTTQYLIPNSPLHNSPRGLRGLICLASYVHSYADASAYMCQICSQSVQLFGIFPIF